MSGGTRERGIAALELALVLPLFLMLLAFPLLFGRYFYYYEITQKAARDAARYLSAAAPMNMRSYERAGSEVAIARAIVDAGIATINPGSDPPLTTIACDGLACGGLNLPNNVSVTIQVNVRDPLFSPYTSGAIGELGLRITASATMSYAGD